MGDAQGLADAELRRHSGVSDALGAADVAAAWGIIAVSLWASAALGAWWAHAAAAVVISSRQAALANLAHDAWHGLYFQSRRVNDAVGSWLYSYPVGIPFFHDRRRHLEHHRTVGRRNDPDWVNYTNEGRETAGRVLAYLGGRLTGSLLVSTAWSALTTRKPRISAPAEDAAAERRGPRHEMLRVAICQLTLALCMALAFEWWTYLALWLAPLATLTAFCNNLRALVEHASSDDDARPESRLRDIDAGPLERSFFSPAHFHYHALHHAYPTIPHYRLAAAKRALVKELGTYPYPVAPGYVRTLRSHLDDLRSPGPGE